MKKNNKKIILVVIAILLIGMLISLTIIKHNDSSKKPSTEESTIKLNKSSGIIEDRNIDNIIFSDIECSIENGNTTIRYKVTNNNDVSTILGEYNLIFKDKNNNIIGTVYAEDNTSIEPNSYLNITNTATIDLTKATVMEIEFKEG